jgi:hypothetical protein
MLEEPPKTKDFEHLQSFYNTGVAGLKYMGGTVVQERDADSL